MIKYILIVINIVGLIFVSLVNEDVVIEIDSPEQVNAGSDFTVRVTIKKTNIERFARFVQEMPIGFTASEGDSKNAMFSFKDQQAKFLWIPGSLPKEDEFTFTYKIHVDEQMFGKVELGGQFIYIKDNDRVTLDLTPKVITIISNNLAANTDSLGNPILNSAIDSAKISCIRQTPFINNKGELIINILVNKGNLEKDKFAKIQEDLPKGYTAENIENNSGIFTVQNNTAKYLWMNLPPEQEFVISYKLIPITAEASNYIPENFNGTFSYVENEITKSINITQQKSIKSDILTAFNSQHGFNPPVDTSKTNDIALNNNKNGNQNNSNNDTAVTENKHITNVTPPETGGVSYSIQICALKKYRNPNYFHRKYYKINDKVKLENHQSLNKYTIGNFSVYKDARDYRVKVWNTTPIKDAFVSAYNNGNRITVQEALMISSQSWFQ